MIGQYYLYNSNIRKSSDSGHKHWNYPKKEKPMATTNSRYSNIHIILKQSGRIILCANILNVAFA